MHEISTQLIKVHRLFANKQRQWFTSADAVRLLPGVARRTFNHHARRLTEAGVLEKAEVFGGYRYRYADAPNKDVVEQINAAAKAFEL